MFIAYSGVVDIRLKEIPKKCNDNFVTITGFESLNRQ